MMRLVSVNVGQPQPIASAGRTIQTGIFKQPVSLPVPVGKLGLEGDVQVNQKHHGGPDQAVYVYSAEDYAWWSEQLGRTLTPGSFGENLTFSCFAGEELHIGDRWRIGDVLLEITSPRIPCSKLAARMEDAGFVKRFKQAERPGAYTRVLQTGRIEIGDEVSYLRGDSDVTLTEVFRLHYEKSPSRADIRRLLAAPIGQRGRLAYQAKLDA